MSRRLLWRPPASRTSVALLLAAVLLLGPLLGCGGRAVPVQRAMPVQRAEIMMDTLVSVKGYGEQALAQKAVDAAFEAMKRVDACASFHRADSELSRLNRDRHLVPSDLFAEILQTADTAWKRGDGYFDPTFAVLYQAYGFYNKQPRLPERAERLSCLDRMGWGRTVTLGETGASLASGALIDLGGIAGGVAVTKAALAMRNAGCKAFFIDDGGDLWMEGAKPDGTPWTVAVKDPRTTSTFLATVQTTHPTAVSTSGNYERFVEIDGRRYGHIMDPVSGLPADHFVSVTVVASSPGDADFLSTLLFALPPEQARARAVRDTIPVLILDASGTVWLSPSGESWFRDVLR